MFFGVIYFAGPKTRWPRSSGDSSIHPSEIIWRSPHDLRWRWLVRGELLAKFRGLYQDRCGYALMQSAADPDGEDVCLEQYDPPLEA